MDFRTLYVVILLNSLALCAIWGAIAFSYRDLKPARFWLASCVLSLTCGVVLALQGNAGFFIPTIAANAIMLLGLFNVWMGVRIFHGEPMGWRTAGVLIALCVAAEAASFYPWWGQNPLYTAAQIMPLMMTIRLLLQKDRRSLGSWMAAIAMAVAILGNGAVAFANAAALIGTALPQATMAQLLSVNLIVMIFSGVVWNFGLIVMTVDRLRGELEHLATQDALTGLHNRRYLADCLSTELRRALRTHAPLCLMMIDVDRFKPINDGFGHPAGDACLRHVADLVKRQLRADDVFVRLGGDEFCILLADTGLGEAATLAERIVSTVRASPLIWKGSPVPLSLSAGLSTLDPSMPRDAADLLENADAALYTAKKRGRDRYSIYAAPTALKSA